ncbi:jg17155 [Pararge aegeria aegeria]|uniref:Jg17155 protein n=1 Tax=Pararge aegeria aegeria TaxID=348720 RepID=A0A8S4RLX9_9NEOP|nr:jg17155 [Pararge aegeria aegeria]
MSSVRVAYVSGARRAYVRDAPYNQLLTTSINLDKFESQFAPLTFLSYVRFNLNITSTVKENMVGKESCMPESSPQCSLRRVECTKQLWASVVDYGLTPFSLCDETRALYSRIFN